MTSPPRLLLLEDDDGLRTSLQLVMEDAGYDVMAAANAEDALTLLADVTPDIMLVDLMLGGMDGFSFIRRVRPTTDAPVVVISARDDTDDIVAALEAGADDYVTKPFVVEEVQARMRAMLRRPVIGESSRNNPRPDLLTLDSQDGPLVLDQGAGVLRRGDEGVHLTQTEYKLLGVLAGSSGRVFSRSALLELVWDRGFFGDERIVDVHVRRLRKKLERSPSAPELLVTVRGLGYRLDPR